MVCADNESLAAHEQTHTGVALRAGLLQICLGAEVCRQASPRVVRVVLSSVVPSLLSSRIQLLRRELLRNVRNLVQHEEGKPGARLCKTSKVQMRAVRPRISHEKRPEST